MNDFKASATQPSPISGVSLLLADLKRCQPRYTPRDAFKGQQLRENNVWDAVALEEALASLERRSEWHSVEHYTAILQKCRKSKSLAYAERVYMHIRDNGLENHAVLGNYLIPMFVECGSVSSAQQVFDRLVYRNEYSWTSLIQGYIDCGEPQHALNLFQDMQENCVRASPYTYVALLKACAKLKCLERGCKIHSEVARQGIEGDPFIGSTLVDMYAKCGSLATARDMFDKLQVRDAVSWTTLIAGYAEHGLGQEALNCLDQMQSEGMSLDAVTSVCSLKACGHIGAIDSGREIHAEIAKHGYEGNSFVSSSLVDMYSKCSSLAEAQEVLDKLPARDVVSWSALIAGYAEQGLGEEALNCLEQMQQERVCPDVVAFASSLKACGSMEGIDRARKIHNEIVNWGFESDPFIGSILVDIYAKFGSLAEAWEVFEKLSIRDVVAWTALMAGFAEHGLGEEALNCFRLMQLEGWSPDATTFACSLKACGNIGAINQGREIHAEISRQGLERDSSVSNALVDMYAKCYLLVEAQEVFGKLPVRDVISWSALIAGYARQGEIDFVFHLFDLMGEEGIRPDSITFLSVLNVCSHAGLVDKGLKYFDAMSKEYSISPAIEHYNCMIDLLCRAGQVDGALMMFQTMPFQPDLAMWCTMLGACQKWGNVELGSHLFEYAVRLDEKYAAPFILMSNIYADA